MFFTVVTYLSGGFMDVIKWRDSFAIGVEAMDIQHKTIIDLINKLYKEIRSEKPGDAALEILEEMAVYAESHLREEEELLETIKYPDSENHFAMHQSYRDALSELRKEVKTGHEKAAMETYTFLRQWWTNHIMTEDKKYGEFIDQE